MAIKIEWQIKPPSKSEDRGKEKPQMFPRITDSEVVDVERLAETITKRGGLTKGTVVDVLSDLPNVMAELLSEGKTVEIPMLGSFNLSIGTDAQIHPDSKRRMRSVEVRGVKFQPDKELMKAIGKPTFQWQAGTGFAIAQTSTQLIPLLEDYFKTHESITRKEFEQTFGLKRTTAYIRLKELVDRGVMKAIGSGRDTVYMWGDKNR